MCLTEAQSGCILSRLSWGVSKVKYRGYTNARHFAKFLKFNALAVAKMGEVYDINMKYTPKKITKVTVW